MFSVIRYIRSQITFPSLVFSLNHWMEVCVNAATSFAFLSRMIGLLRCLTEVTWLEYDYPP